MRATFFFLVRAIILVAFPLMVLLNFPHSPDGGTLWVIRIIMIFGTIALIAWYTRDKYMRPLKKKNGGKNVMTFDDTLASELQRQAGQEKISFSQAMFFVTAIRAPRKVRQRLVEEYRPGQRVLREKVTIDIQVPHRFLPADTIHDPAQLLSESLPIPLLISPKSRMHDNLDIIDSDGNILSTLSYREYLSLAAGVLRLLLVSAFQGQLPTDPKGIIDLNNAEIGALMQIVARRNDRKLACGDAADTKELMLLRKATKAAIGKLESLRAPNKEILQLAADLVEVLAENYVIVVPARVPLNGRLVLQYSRTVVPAMELSSGSMETPRRVKEFLGVFLGAGPIDIRLPLENACTCQSYHIRVQGPDGYYLSHQRLFPDTIENPEFDDEAEAEPEPTGMPYRFEPHYRFRSRLGQSYAHFYGRHFPSITSSNPDQKDELIVPTIKFAFHEVPPGTDFQATAAAASAAFLIGLIGFALSHPQSGGKFDLGSDIPVLLLAFPGVVASWLGLDGADVHLFDTSLSARLSLVATVLLSVVASAVYIINSEAVEPSVFFGSLSGGISLLGVTRDWWVGLTAAAVINAMCITYRCVIRAWRFAYLARRNPLG